MRGDEDTSLKRICAELWKFNGNTEPVGMGIVSIIPNK